MGRLGRAVEASGGTLPIPIQSCLNRVGKGLM